jgi:hypothetical protein
MRTIVILACCAVTLGACNVTRHEEKKDQGTPSAVGKAKEGTVEIKAPGVSFSVDVPDSVRSEMGIHGGDKDLIYPGAKFGGMYIEGREKAGGEPGGGAVEMSFTSADAPDKVAKWYQDPARKDTFSVEAPRQEGAGFVMTGRPKEGHGSFTIRLMPKAGGGTDGRLDFADAK